MKLIDKDKMVAEIERLDALYHISKSLTGDLFIEGLLSFLNTLEVKDVDLEKELDKWYNNKAPKEFENILYEDIEKCAKHFFELGIKVSRKTTVVDREIAEEFLLDLKRLENDYKRLMKKIQKGE